MDGSVLVTGCSSGIGRATAQAFLDQGAAVYATARNPGDVRDLARAGCETPALDVTDGEGCREVVEQVVEETGRVDVLVNNAGFGQHGPIEDVPVDRVRAQFEVNVYGPHRLTRAVLPYMRAQGSGRIINISSVAGRVSTPGTGVYAGSKFALEAMSDALRNEVDDHGVHVILVEPGPVPTGFADRTERELGALARSDAYQTIYALHRDATAIDGFHVSAAYVADTIVEAACTPRPRARYTPGTAATLVVSARHLPDRVRDAAFRLVKRLV